MKTKNFLLTGALLIMALFSVNGVMAADPSYTTNVTTTSDVKVSLIFNPIQSIQVNTSTDHTAINFEYSTPKDYTQGINVKSQSKKDHLTVYHSGPFNVTITSTNFVNIEDPADIIYGDHVFVSAVKSSSSTDGTITLAAPVRLNQYAAGSQFIASDNGAMGLTFDVLYDHSNANIADYLNRNLNNKKTTYQATVTYTIAAQ